MASDNTATKAAPTGRTVDQARGWCMTDAQARRAAEIAANKRTAWRETDDIRDPEGARARQARRKDGLDGLAEAGHITPNQLVALRAYQSDFLTSRGAGARNTLDQTPRGEHANALSSIVDAGARVAAIEAHCTTRGERDLLRCVGGFGFAISSKEAVLAWPGRYAARVDAFAGIAARITP